MNPDGMVALMNYRVSRTAAPKLDTELNSGAVQEDGSTPYFTFWKVSHIASLHGH